MPPELPNNLRQDLRKSGNYSKISKRHRIVAYCSVLVIKILSVPAKIY